MTALENLTRVSAVGIGRHKHYTTIYCHLPNSRFDIFLFQSLQKAFSFTLPRPDIQPYLSTRWTGQTRFKNSQAVTTSPPHTQ